MSRPRNEEVRDKTIEPITAEKKLSMSKPGVIWAASINSKTFKMRAKRPRVRKVMGRATNWRTGLMNMLMTPITMAATSAVESEETTKPGTR